MNGFLITKINFDAVPLYILLMYFPKSRCARMYACTRTHVCAHTRTHTYTCTHTRTCMQARERAHARTPIYRENVTMLFRYFFHKIYQISYFSFIGKVSDKNSVNQQNLKK